jgi:membrane associated rhomboid family serine protease
MNVLIFALQLLVDIPFGDFPPVPGRPGGFAVGLLSFVPSSFFKGCIWQPLTYQFLHAGLLHLFMNMLWLYFFGPHVERALGTRQFFRFYILCGALAVLATVLPWRLLGSDVSVTGASGAVMAVLVAYAVISPDRQFFVFPLPQPITARALVIIVIVMNVFFGVGNSGDTSVATHLGGMAVGYLYMKGVPAFRRWRLELKRRGQGLRNDVDVIGEMVDNIFRFEGRKRRH